MMSVSELVRLPTVQWQRTETPWGNGRLQLLTTLKDTKRWSIGRGRPKWMNRLNDCYKNASYSYIVRWRADVYRS